MAKENGICPECGLKWDRPHEDTCPHCGEIINPDQPTYGTQGWTLQHCIDYGGGYRVTSDLAYHLKEALEVARWAAKFPCGDNWFAGLSRRKPDCGTCVTCKARIIVRSR